MNMENENENNTPIKENREVETNRVNEEGIDFFKEASAFMKEALPEDFGKRIEDFYNDKNLNHSEKQLFKHMCCESIQLEFIMALLRTHKYKE